MPRFTQCHFCRGELQAKSGPGRWREYRGVQCEIPAALAIDTCTSCGREWLSPEQIDALDDSFEQQRRAATPAILQPVSAKAEKISRNAPALFIEFHADRFGRTQVPALPRSKPLGTAQTVVPQREFRAAATSGVTFVDLSPVTYS